MLNKDGKICELKKRICESIRKNQNIWAIYVLLSKIKRGDTDSINLFLTIEDRADYIRILKKGEENVGKVVYVIGEMGRVYGFFAEFRIMLSGLYYAERMGFIPYVRWGKNFAYYERDGVDGIFNAFEYYFEPLNTSIDISRSNAVTYCKMAQIQEVSVIENSQGYVVSSQLENILTDVLRRNIQIRKELLSNFEEQVEYFYKGKHALGIHYRGTDFNCGYNNHPIAVQKEQMIENAKGLIEKYNIEIIFLATDDLRAIEVFKKAFGNKLKFFEDVYRGTNNINIAFSEAKREKHHYRLGVEILRDVYMLSRCDYLISGLSQVSLAARMFKKSRGEVFVEDLTINNGINSGTVEFEMSDH